MVYLPSQSATAGQPATASIASPILDDEDDEGRMSWLASDCPT